MAEESCGFYAGIFLVVTGAIFIVGMGVYSIHNPLEGQELNNQVESYRTGRKYTCDKLDII